MPSSPLCKDGRRRRLLHFVKMADVAVFSSATSSFQDGCLRRCDCFSCVIANWSSHMRSSSRSTVMLLQVASAQNITHGEEFSDCLGTVLACSGDPLDSPDSIGTSSPGVWLTSHIGHFGPSRGRRLVCLLSYSSFSRNVTFGESHQIVSVLILAA